MTSNVRQFGGRFLALALGILCSQLSARANDLRLVTLSGGSATVHCEGKEQALKIGECVDHWTLMATLPGETPLAVLEDFSQLTGRLLIIGPKGIVHDFAKSAEPTFAETDTIYNGHNEKEVKNSEQDLLGREMLASGNDPDYGAVARCFIPLHGGQPYTFVGTHDSLDKVGIEYGGRTPNFDPAVYVRAIEKIRKKNRVIDGLVGGWLPALRFVYPESDSTWSEMVCYAPFRKDESGGRIQPVWYRVARVENGTLQWARYFDSYHPFPPRSEAQPEPFYREFLTFKDRWEKYLAPGMQIKLPDAQFANIARHGLVRDLITRIGPFPKYGVMERNYGGPEHDGFPDTFNADTSAMLEWGLFDLARDFIDNYFSCFVEDDGAIRYRGPETGQFGRMLTVVAQYYRYSHDDALLLKHRRRIDAIADLLIAMREPSLKLPTEDPAFGIISGWSEADSCLSWNPERFMKPYYSNSTEAARGFADLGTVWKTIGQQRNLPDLKSRGERLLKLAEEMNRDVQRSIERTLIRDCDPPCLPTVAGEKLPFHEALLKDPDNPQYRAYRANMEMLFSGNLTKEQIETVIRYRTAHYDVVLGMPMAYGLQKYETAGFLAYGHAYGLVQVDMPREFILMLYAMRAHQHTRGTWSAPETRRLKLHDPGSGYCTPSQVLIPLMTRWMLVFEEPTTEVLWLCKTTPREWLADGKSLEAKGAPTRWGKVDVTLLSQLNQKRIKADLVLPPHSPVTYLRLRVPSGREMESVTLNGQPLKTFDAVSETITLPAGLSGAQQVEVLYKLK